MNFPGNLTQNSSYIPECSSSYLYLYECTNLRTIRQCTRKSRLPRLEGMHCGCNNWPSEKERKLARACAAPEPLPAPEKTMLRNWNYRLDRRFFSCSGADDCCRNHPVASQSRRRRASNRIATRKLPFKSGINLFFTSSRIVYGFFCF